MAEVVSERDPQNERIRMRVRTRNALGYWDWLIDGETGKPYELAIPDKYVQGLSNPRETMEQLGNYMLRIAERATMMENVPW